MRNKKKAIFNTIFPTLIFSITVYMVFKGEDLGEIIHTVRQADPVYLLISVVCVVLFILGESVIIFYMMRTLGAKVKMGHCALYSFVGFFFSCITPSATGGQPAQIYYMKKEKIPIPVSTLVLMIVTITYKMVLVVIGLGLMIFGRGFIRTHMYDIRHIFYLGTGLNVFCVASMLLLVFHPVLARSILVKGMELLEKMRIRNPEEVLEKYPHQLSGGMLQRIMIGIATAMKPALLIADEPTTALDAITQYEILNELLHIKENHNTAMIFISHDLNAISRVADRIVVLNHGAVVDRGDFQHILHHAQAPYTKLLVEKRADVMRRYTAVLNGKKETAHA